MTTEQEYEQVHAALVAVAARCDGAVEEDFRGFNGVDTHFGRRVAAVPFEQWTEAVKDEAAHIILKYREQVLSYTGIDVAKIQVVLDAQGHGTNYAGREDARHYEKLAQHLSARKVDYVDGNFTLAWDKKDPDFGQLLGLAKRLPGRKFDWDHKVNVAPLSDELVEFINTWDLPLTPAAKAALSQPVPERYHVTLTGEPGDFSLLIDTPYEPALVALIRGLEGRRYIGGSLNSANASFYNYEALDGYGLKIGPGVKEACAAPQPAQEPANDRRALLAHVSRCGSPEALTTGFLCLLDEVLEGLS